MDAQRNNYSSHSDDCSREKIMHNLNIGELVEALKDLFEEAARIEKRLPDKEKRFLRAKVSWPDYVYDADDRKDQEAEPMRLTINARQLGVLTSALKIREMLGSRTNLRIMWGKKIIWARAMGFSYSQIAEKIGRPLTTIQYWHKHDLIFLVKKLEGIL